MISKFHSDPNFRWWNVFQTSSFILFSKLSCIEFEIMCSQSSDWNDLWVGNSAKIIMLNQKNYVVELWVGLVIIENQYWLMVLPILKIWNSMGKTIPYIVEKCSKPPTRICWKLLPELKDLGFFGMSNFQCGHHLAVRVLGWRCCSDLWFGCTSHVSCVQNPKCRSHEKHLG